MTRTTAPPTGWSVELSSNGEVVDAVGQDSPDFTIASLGGLQPGTQYTVRVAGLNTRGLGNFSEPVTTSSKSCLDPVAMFNVCMDMHAATSSSGDTTTVLTAVIVILAVLIIMAILVVISSCLYRLKHAQDPLQQEPATTSLTPCAAYGVFTVKGPTDSATPPTKPSGGPAGQDTVNFTEPEYETITEFHH